MQPRRVTSLDQGYRQGDLSVFPKAIDSVVSLFEAVNNVETKLLHNLTPISKYIIVENPVGFPSTGLVKIGSRDQYEVVFYSKKIGNQLHLLQRGYGNSNARHWATGEKISCPVMAEHHNALKDAIIKIQRKIGILNDNNPDTIFGQLKSLEQKWLSPKATFRAFPRKGSSPLTVQFQNFSTGYALKFLWDFGDGTTSTEQNPSHTFIDEKLYTIKLNIISSNGAASVAEKNNYIEVNNEQRKPFFYVRPFSGQSIMTAQIKMSQPTEFVFVDQTGGSISERNWYVGDGKEATIADRNIHYINHTYENPGEYYPTLLVRYTNGKISKATTPDGVLVF